MQHNRYLNPLSLTFYPALGRVFVCGQQKCSWTLFPAWQKWFVSFPQALLWVGQQCVVGDGQSSAQPGSRMGTRVS